METRTALPALLRAQLARVLAGFRSLSRAPPELRKAYLLKFLDSYAYFSFSVIFALFLSDDFGMSDVAAGAAYGAWGALVTVYGLVAGPIIDRLGVAKCLRIGFVLSLLSRLAIFVCTSRAALLFCVLVSLPFANCLGIPVLTVGIRRYTDESNRGFAFGLFYVVMNVGALVAGPLVDALTVYYNERGRGADATASSSTGASREWSMTSHRAIVLSGVAANLVAVFVAFTVREIKADATKERASPRPPRPGSTDSSAAATPPSEVGVGSAGDEGEGGGVSEFRPLNDSSRRILAETARSPNFRRFLVVCLLTLNVRMIFRHLDGTLPKYMVREFGENTPKGRVYAINPALIIVLVPIVTAATTAVDPLVMIHHGTYVSALSVFFLAFSTSLPACVLFVATLSIGEAIWSPRLYDYTMSVAREGREGTYMALSSAPLFLAKLPVGFLSGWLLQRYCPEHLEEGEVRRSKTMWWIIGLTTAVSPIMLTLLWGYISGDNAEGRVNGNGVQLGDGGRSVGDGNEESTEGDPLVNSYQRQPLATNHHQIP